MRPRLQQRVRKVQAEQQWASLLDDEAGRKKKGLTELAQSVEGLEEPLKAYGVS